MSMPPRCSAFSITWSSSGATLSAPAISVCLPSVRSSALVALRDPDSIGIATRVLAIPMKREDKKLIGYLTRTEIQALLAAPDQSKWSGRRDHALLLTLYNSGARVSEVTTLTRAQVCFGASTFVQLHREGPQRAHRPAVAATPHRC